MAIRATETELSVTETKTPELCVGEGEAAASSGSGGKAIVGGEILCADITSTSNRWPFLQ